MKKTAISIIAPAFNEAQNLNLLIKKTISAVKKITSTFELIIIDDGSTDDSWSILKKQKLKYSQLKAIRFRRRSGQTAALMAGFRQAKGDIIVTIDSDLQQDPKDIRKLINHIKKGSDVVSGQRPKQTRAFIYSFISTIEKLLIKLLLKIDIKDTNVSPNAYKSKILKEINLYGEMHRYLVPMLSWQGYQVDTVPVSLHPRHKGQSKYKPTKAIKGFLDLLILKFWQDYSARPIHFFGGLGLVIFSLGFITGLITVIRKFIFHLSLFNVSLLLLAIFLCLIGLQFFIFGILADIVTRLYFKNTSNYQIEKVL